ncbi:uncharacterized protein (TIGR02270 family) [Alteromonadaceae bacterium 2753L.S.0a.02]|nr:uncharacterized protein (TIGR02270 family) [Alteromonadaceae bacterium 2753L.S.0a.02]
MSAYRHILEQHVDDAAFLWVLRAAAINQPHYLVSDIVSLETRIDNNLDGILASLQRSWPLCLRAAEFEEGGEAFMLAVTAFRSLEVDKIKNAVDLAVANPKTFKGFVSAMGWLPGKLCHDWIKKFFSSKELVHKYLAVAACSVRRENPGDYLVRMLEREDCIAHDLLYSRCLRTIGELKLADKSKYLETALSSESKVARFWAIWSLILLGQKQYAVHLEEFVFANTPQSLKAVALAFRVLPLETAKSWISRLSHSEENLRLIIKAISILGDPQALPWLLDIMKNPRHARLAGEAFSCITGVNLETNELSLELPNIEELEQEMAPDEIDEDENLPWPSIEKLVAIWEKYGRGFTQGTRYFLGKPINDEILKNTVLHGYQRSRHAAALELALRNPSQMLVNTEASHQY